MREVFRISCPPPPVGHFRWHNVTYPMGNKPRWFHRKMIALFFGAIWHDA